MYIHKFLAMAVALSIVVPATSRAAPPEAVRTLQDALLQTAAIVECDVSDISYSYDEQRGPRTLIRLAIKTTHWGTFSDPSVVLSVMGGPLPDGRYLDIPELPHFATNSHYIVFLSNREWFYSPVVADLAFRSETVNNREILIGQDGAFVVGVSLSGIDRAPFSAFDSVADHFKRFDRPQRTVGVVDADFAAAASKAQILASLKLMAAGLKVAQGGAFVPVPYTTGASWRITPTGNPIGPTAPQAPTKGGRP